MVAKKHERFTCQSSWTRSLRDYLLSTVSLKKGARVLEVGCGTGVILHQTSEQLNVESYGIDKDIHCLDFALTKYSKLHLVNGLGENLPFSNECFDLIFCHYFLLWVKDPLIVLKDIFRVLKTDGSFMIFAEPDYYSRVDAPEDLVLLGQLQNKSLANQGCRLYSGRSLPGWLVKSGFSSIKFGISGFETFVPGSPDWLESEWTILNDDLASICSFEELSSFKQKDLTAWQNGERVLWVPTFYAVAKKIE